MDPSSRRSRSVLLVSAIAEVREALAALLARAGYKVAAVGSLVEMDGLVGGHHLDIALLYLDAAPAEVIQDCRRRVPEIPCVVIADASRSGLGSLALRAGADDYLTYPPDPYELRLRIDRSIERREIDARIAVLQGEILKSQKSTSLVSRSPPMQAVTERLRRLAPMRATVLIYGESGVGKELVARAIHLGSPRREAPFIALNCAAIPQNLIESELFGHERGSFTGAHSLARGKFEIAHRGTLFLDEIGEMNHAAQAKLLRVLEEREFMRVGGARSIRVDVRVIAATNANLEDLVERAQFRRDLYYRLKVVSLHVPPLRERREDIPILVDTFLVELARANALRPKAIHPQALAALCTYQWPGNVRELKNILESVLVSSPGEIIGPEDLPPSVRRDNPSPVQAGLSQGRSLAEMERELIRRTLESSGGNRTHSAASLGIGVRTLQRKIREYGLEIPSRRRRSRRTPTRDAPR
jgi:DNA-binding NtrC family response regulator